VTAPGRIRLLIADDHPVVREGLRTLLARHPDIDIVGEAATGAEAVALSKERHPDIALVDLRMPGMDGEAVIQAIVASCPATQVIVVTTFCGDEDVYQALRAGAKAYLLKDAPRDDLLGCIRAVREGRSWLSERAAATLTARLQSQRRDLTPRERDVLELVVLGRSNKEVASALRMAEGTVKAHMNRVFRKLGVESRAEAVKVALQRGLAHLDS
jgi:two-component system NarL family response regulator